MFKEKILQDIKEAMKAKDELKLSVLRMLSSAIKNKELEKRAKTGKEEALNDEEVMTTIRSEAKKRKDAVESFEKGGRKDLADKEAAEMKILEVYLPAEMPDEELEKIAKEVVAGLGEVTQKDFGRAMGEVMKKVKGQASGDRVSAMVKRLLGK